MGRIERGSTGRVIRFLTKDNVRLNGILYSKSSTKNCIVYLHGMGGSMISGISFGLAQNLGKDISLFSFNNRGHDTVSSFSRFNGKKRKRFTAGLNFEKFEDSVYDISGAIDALSKLGYRKFVLCGSSTGCQKAAYYQYKTQDKRVSALVLLGPADDYNLHRKELGKRYGNLLAECKRLIKSGKSDAIPDPALGFSAQRLDSQLNPKRTEARMFDYNGDLREFGSIKAPVLAVFGSNEEFKLMPIKRYLELLDVRSNSVRFRGLIIDGAGHSFEGKEKELSKEVYSWLSKI